MQRAGTHWLHSCAFVLMAGGTGRRLGIKGAKLAQTAETATNNTLLEHFITHILAFQYEAKKLPSDKPFDYIPIVIMTSDESHQVIRYDAFEYLIFFFFFCRRSKICLKKTKTLVCLRGSAG